MRRTRLGMIGAAGVAAQLALAMSTQAQDGSAPPEKKPETPPTETAPPATPPKDEPLPNLDELLGLPGTSPGDAPDPGRTDLDRILSGAEIGNAFKQAVTLMGDVAKRMGEGGDVSLTTQRMQETILRRLDQLISSLEQQQNQQQQQQQQQQSSSQQSQANQRVPSQQRTEQNQEQQGDNTGQTNNPDRRDGPLRPALDSARASWGNLPDRVREMLVQGSTDRFSSLYDSLTQSYYRRLAEEAKQR